MKKDNKVTKSNEKQSKTKSAVICPICGKEMDETYHGKQCCYDCEKKLRGDK